MWSKIISLLGSSFIKDTIGAIGEQLNKAYETKMTAQTEEQKMEADLTIKQLEAREQVLLAELHDRMTSWIRPALITPFLIYDFKVLVIDKVLALGVTDDLTANFWYLHMLIFSFYFLGRPLEKWLKK